MERHVARIHDSEDFAVRVIHGRQRATAFDLDVTAARTTAQKIHADQIRHIARARSLGHLRGRPCLEHAAVLEDQEPIGQRYRLERVVRDKESDPRELRERVLQIAAHAHAARRVQRGKRLVQ